MTYGSWFSNAGLADHGLEAASMTGLWGCEIEPLRRSVFAANFPGAAVYDDIRTFPSADVPVPDVLWLSPPCQDLSVAGKRKGLAGERSGLFYDAVKHIRVLRDRGLRFAVMEQVPGLLSSNRGEDFRSVLLAFCDLRFVSCAWRVLDSQWFGVAQQRRRFYFVLDFRGGRAGEILSLAQSLRGDSPPSRKAGTQVAEGVAGSLGVGGGKRGWSDDFERSGAFIPETTPALTTSQGRLDDQQLGQLVPSHRRRVRRLTPTECERLQGVPVGFTAFGADGKPVSDTQRYSMIGDGVTGTVSRWIGVAIATQLQEVHS